MDYTIEFIGTRRDLDLSGTPIENVPSDIQGQVSMEYSDEIGVVLATEQGTSASYELGDDELYVRARVTSSKPHPHGYKADDQEMAWTQPLVSPRISQAR